MAPSIQDDPLEEANISAILGGASKEFMEVSSENSSSVQFEAAPDHEKDPDVEVSMRT